MCCGCPEPDPLVPVWLVAGSGRFDVFLCRVRIVWSYDEKRGYIEGGFFALCSGNRIHFIVRLML